MVEKVITRSVSKTEQQSAELPQQEALSNSRLTVAELLKRINYEIRFLGLRQEGTEVDASQVLSPQVESSSSPISRYLLEREGLSSLGILLVHLPQDYIVPKSPVLVDAREDVFLRFSSLPQSHLMCLNISCVFPTTQSIVHMPLPKRSTVSGAAELDYCDFHEGDGRVSMPRGTRLFLGRNQKYDDRGNVLYEDRVLMLVRPDGQYTVPGEMKLTSVSLPLGWRNLVKDGRFCEPKPESIRRNGYQPSEKEIILTGLIKEGNPEAIKSINGQVVEILGKSGNNLDSRYVDRFGKKGGKVEINVLGSCGVEFTSDNFDTAELIREMGRVREKNGEVPTLDQCFPLDRAQGRDRFTFVLETTSSGVALLAGIDITKYDPAKKEHVPSLIYYRRELKAAGFNSIPEFEELALDKMIEGGIASILCNLQPIQRSKSELTPVKYSSYRTLTNVQRYEEGCYDELIRHTKEREDKERLTKMAEDPYDYWNDRRHTSVMTPKVVTVLDPESERRRNASEEENKARYKREKAQQRMNSKKGKNNRHKQKAANNNHKK